MSESINEGYYGEKKELEYKKKELIKRIFESRALAGEKIKEKLKESKHKALNNSS